MYETEVLLRSIYRTSLVSKDLAEMQNAIRTMMKEEDVAYVEKMVAQLKDESA